LEETNNAVTLCGSPCDTPKFSHASGTENYYTFPLEIERLSGACDRINVIAKEAMLAELVLGERSRLRVEGELRSFNNKHGEGSRLVITVFAKDMAFTDGEDKNSVFLSGVICKQPNLRKTPMGRQICDLILAVNRRYGRSDYLPCIAWGRLAERMAERQVGDAVALEGRIQSRKYINTETGAAAERTAFEVSIVSLPEDA
jgi:single-stranded DNA-binding protein